MSNLPLSLAGYSRLWNSGTQTSHSSNSILRTRRSITMSTVSTMFRYHNLVYLLIQIGRYTIRRNEVHELAKIHNLAWGGDLERGRDKGQAKGWSVSQAWTKSTGTRCFKCYARSPSCCVMALRINSISNIPNAKLKYFNRNSIIMFILVEPPSGLGLG